jgi:hypothetical protein
MIGLSLLTLLEIKPTIHNKKPVLLFSKTGSSNSKVYWAGLLSTAPMLAIFLKALLTTFMATTGCLRHSFV